MRLVRRVRVARVEEPLNRVTQPLRELAVRAWEQHRAAEAAGLPHLVRPSVPILFFGDSDSYLASPLRVLSVGLNPSREEFPSTVPYRRFPGGETLDGTNPDAYLAVLNRYFRSDPYTGWFNQSFEQLLRGMGASYYDGPSCVALHTDLCSPLATDPTWSRLGRAERAALEPDGRKLWHDLVEALQPDVVLVSVKRQRLRHIAFPLADPARVIHTVDGPKRTRPYFVESFHHELATGKRPLFVFGQASQTPFGSISGAEKRLIGARVRGLLDA
jgi:hypothetical protein